ncbi:MAG: S-layer homology domain-containing protein [Candidatus Margulisiibacteriota bacterium]|jgi:hypothetical protein
MKKRLIAFTLIFVLLVSTCSYAQTKNTIAINDVPPNDPTYNYISNSISDGYLTLLKDKNFAPDQPVTRREVSIIINKLLDEIEVKKTDLSKAELQELTNLSKTFKTYLVSSDTFWNKSEGRLKKIEADQTVNNNDINKLSEQLENLRRERDTERIYIISGGVILLLIALFVH